MIRAERNVTSSLSGQFCGMASFSFLKAYASGDREEDNETESCGATKSYFQMAEWKNNPK